jgi:hypothetical protein
MMKCVYPGDQLQPNVAAASVAVDAGYDLQSDTRVDGLLRDLILTYGELTQATYDRLGLDPCDSATYGTTVVKPPEMLKYLDQDYPLAPDEIPNGRPAARDL